MDQAWLKKQIARYQSGIRSEQEDQVIIETPLTIFLNENEIVTLLCTPMHQEDLAVGFLAGEGFLQKPTDLLSVNFDKEANIVWVKGTSSLLAEKTFLKRFLASGCGKGTTFYNFGDTRISPIPVQAEMMSGSVILDAVKKLQTQPSIFRETGGTHGVFLISPVDIVCFREDIGRHNAADKILGKCFQENIPLQDKALVSTGRISSEILLKVAKMSVPILVSRSAPTSLAVELAERLGVTLIGFARGERMNIYTYPERIA